MANKYRKTAQFIIAIKEMKHGILFAPLIGDFK